MRRLAFALVAVALLITVQSIGALARPIHGDEIPMIRNLLVFGQDRTIVPVQFNYPPLFSYVLAGWVGLVAAWRWLVFGVHPVDFGYGMYWAIGGSFEFSPELASLRLLSVALTFALAWATYRLAGTAFGHREGLLAAFLLVASRLLMERTALALPDVLTSVFATIAMVYTVRFQKVAETDRRAARLRWLVIAGGLAGLAAASKYNGLLVLAGPLLAVAMLAWSERTRLVSWWRALGRGAAVGAAAVGAFLIAAPAVWLAPSAYWRGFRFEARHVREGQLSVDLGELPFGWIPIRLWQNEGLLGLVFLAGLIVALVGWRRRINLVIAAPVVVAILVVGTWRYTSLHYLLWAWPLLAALAARAVIGATERWPRGRALQVAVAALLIVPNVARSVRTTWDAARVPSNALLAERWVEANLPAGERVADDWYGVPTVWNDGLREQYQVLLGRLEPWLSPKRAEALRRKPIFDGELGYLIEPPSAAKVEAAQPDWLLVSTETEPPTAEPLPGYRSPRLADLHRRLTDFHAHLRHGGQYRLACEFTVGPGPAVRIYRRSQVEVVGGGCGVGRTLGWFEVIP
jgi:hypothetical protein